MNNVYLWKQNDKVINHADLQAAADLDGLTRAPDKTVTENEWYQAGGIAHIDDGGVIQLGLTDAEKAEKERREKIAKIERELNALDKEYLTPRVLGGIGLGDQYAISQRNKHEELAAPLRDKMEVLKLEALV